MSENYFAQNFCVGGGGGPDCFLTNNDFTLCKEPRRAQQDNRRAQKLFTWLKFKVARLCYVVRVYTCLLCKLDPRHFVNAFA